MTPDELLSAVADYGVSISRPTLRRYAQIGVISQPEVRRLGRGRGVSSTFRPEAVAEVVAAKALIGRTLPVRRLGGIIEAQSSVRGSISVRRHRSEVAATPDQKGTSSGEVPRMLPQTKIAPDDVAMVRGWANEKWTIGDLEAASADGCEESHRLLWLTHVFSEWVAVRQMVLEGRDQPPRYTVNMSLEPATRLLDALEEERVK